MSLIMPILVFNVVDTGSKSAYIIDYGVTYDMTFVLNIF